MRIVFVLIVLSIILTGCTSQKTDLTKEFVSKDENQYLIYVVYSDNKQMRESMSSDFQKEVSFLHHTYLERLGSLATMFATSDFKKAFDLREFPSVLVFSTEDLILKTTSPKELENLISKEEYILKNE